MKNQLLSLALAAAVISGGFFLFKRSQEKAPVGIGVSEEKENNILTPSAANSASPRPQPVAGEARTKQEAHLDKLVKNGYAENPDDPYTVIKKIKKADGKEITYLMPKDPAETKYFESTNRSEKTALESLESKRNENPEAEVQTLRPLEENDAQSMMLTGKFRDSTNDLELHFARLYGLDGSPQEIDKICFVAPKLGFKMENNLSGKVRTDGTGYAVLQLNPQLYIRVAWSFETKRQLHGEVLRIVNGQAKKETTFTAEESPGALKYCE